MTNEGSIYFLRFNTSGIVTGIREIVAASGTGAIPTLEFTGDHYGLAFALPDENRIPFYYLDPSGNVVSALEDASCGKADLAALPLLHWTGERFIMPWFEFLTPDKVVWRSTIDP
jgi:hypothetical protein